jgi:hypothetical protein
MDKLSNLVSYGGKLYIQNSPLAGVMNSPLGTGVNVDYMVKRGWLTPLAMPSAQQNESVSNTRQPFTPNQFTQQQLAGMGAAPQWMMDAYTNKIQSMGGNANLPPFAVTQSGFPGMGGKTAPAGTTGTGG